MTIATAFSLLTLRVWQRLSGSGGRAPPLPPCSFGRHPLRSRLSSSSLHRQQPHPPKSATSGNYCPDGVQQQPWYAAAPRHLSIASPPSTSRLLGRLKPHDATPNSPPDASGYTWRLLPSPSPLHLRLPTHSGHAGTAHKGVSLTAKGLPVQIIGRGLLGLSKDTGAPPAPYFDQTEQRSLMIQVFWAGVPCRRDRARRG